MDSHYGHGTSPPPNRDEGDEPEAKRVRTCFPEKKSKVVILKFLVTNHEAGSIIGSSGRTIREVHEKSGATIKLSTAREMFPGTEKRVAMLSGGRMEVEEAMSMLLDKMSSDAANWHETLNELDIVVPNNTAGLIIGKGGETIRNLQQDTGVRLKVSDKRDQEYHKLSERRVLVNGDLPRLKQLIVLLLAMIESDPMSGTVPTVTYASHGHGSSTSSSSSSSSHGSSHTAESRSHAHASRASPSNNPSNMPPPPLVAPQPHYDTRPAMPPPTPLIGQVSQPVSSWPGVPPPTAVIELPVPTLLLDRMLNHQPSVLHQIEGYSQASLHPSVNGSPKYRIVTISGTLSAAETGVFLLRQKLQQQSENVNL